jgi:hypothetical protein
MNGKYKQMMHQNAYMTAQDVTDCTYIPIGSSSPTSKHQSTDLLPRIIGVFVLQLFLQLQENMVLQ